MLSGLFLSSLDRSIFILRGVWLALHITMFDIISCTNSVDPDQSVFQCSFYRALGLNGLISRKYGKKPKISNT